MGTALSDGAFKKRNQDEDGGFRKIVKSFNIITP